MYVHEYPGSTRSKLDPSEDHWLMWVVLAIVGAFWASLAGVYLLVSLFIQDVED